MARRYQLKIYDQTYTNLTGAIADEFVSGGNVTTELSGEETLMFTIPKNNGSIIVFGQVIELYNSVEAVIFKAYRVIKKRKKHVGSRYFSEVLCESLKYDLNKRIYEYSGSLIQQTPTTHITAILAGTGWSVGTITPTIKLTIAYDYDTVLGALEKVRLAAVETGVTYDLDFRTKSNFVDLKIVGNQSSTSTIVYGKNLRSLEHESNIPEATRVYGLGGAGQNGVPMTLENHTHRVTAISVNDKTMDSNKIVSSTDSWATFGIENVDTGANTTISGSSKTAGNDILTFAGGGFSIGQRARILDGLKYIRDKATIDLYGNRDIVFRDESFEDVINLIGPYNSSALSGTYTSGLCEGWTKVGLPTATENTDPAFCINGAKSQHITVTDLTVTPSTPTATLQSALPGDLNGSYTYKIAWVTVDGEGPLSAATAGIGVVANAVRIQLNQAVPDSRFLNWSIYRIKDGGTTYYKIKEQPVAITDFYDTLGDTQLTETAPVTNIAAGGQGIKRTFTAVVGKEYSAVIYLYIVSGKVRCELADGSGKTFPEIKADKYATTATTAQQTINMGALVAENVSGEIRILSHGGAAEFYIGSVMVVESPYAPNADKFIADNGVTQLWYAAYDELQKKKVAEESYSLEVEDKYEGGIGAEKFTVGDKVTVTDTILSINASVRIIRKSFNLVQPWKCSMEVNVGQNLRVFTNEYYESRRRAAVSASAASRYYTKIIDTLRQIIGTTREPSVEIKTIV